MTQKHKRQHVRAFRALSKAHPPEGVFAKNIGLTSTKGTGDAVTLFPLRFGKMLFIGSLLLVLVFYCWVALRCGNIGAWQDDSIYMCTAKSLAEGNGYRHMEMPGNPFETKYQPLYPAILVPVFMLGRDFSDNLRLLFLPGAFAGAALAVIAVAYCRRVFNAGRTMTLVIAGLAVINPMIISFVAVSMSELLYASLAAAALLLADGVSPERTAKKIETKGNPGRVSVIAILCALAVLTRSIGVTLVAAFLLKLAAERRWKELAVASLVVCLFLAPYQLWKAHAVGQNGPLQTYRLSQFNLDYSFWLPHSPAETLNVIKQNVFKTVYCIGCYLFTWSSQWRNPNMLPCMHAAGWSLSALLCIGFIKTARRRWRTIHYYAVTYFLMMLSWPFQPSRFLVPWVPFLLFWIIEGLTVCLEQMRKLLVRVRPLAKAPAVIFCLFIVATGALFAYENGIKFVTGNQSLPFSEEDPLEREEIAQWVNEHTSPSDIIASSDPAFLYLKTGRKGFVLWPINDPYRTLYNKDRSWTTFYDWPAKSEMGFLFQEIRSGIADTYSMGGIRWVIINDHSDMTEFVLSIVAKENPQLFRLMYASPTRRITIYRYLNT